MEFFKIEKAHILLLKIKNESALNHIMGKLQNVKENILSTTSKKSQLVLSRKGITNSSAADFCWLIIDAGRQQINILQVRRQNGQKPRILYVAK